MAFSASVTTTQTTAASVYSFTPSRTLIQYYCYCYCYCYY